MSLTDDTADIHRKMLDLQEKLKQSEAERLRLEEMFNLLMRIFKEEEKIRLKNLENRYHLFLEDCAKRSNRNEKILRSVERVESGANALYAKTERLKFLRNHYEAYLERISPAWKQPSQRRYGPSQLLSSQVGRSMRNHQHIPEEVIESNWSHGLAQNLGIPFSYTPISSQSFLNRFSENGEFDRSHSSSRSHYNPNFWAEANKESELKLRSNQNHKKERGNSEYISFPPWALNHTDPSLGRYSHDFPQDEPDHGRANIKKKMVFARPPKSWRGNEWNLPRHILYQQGILNEFSDPEFIEERDYYEKSHQTFPESQVFNESLRSYNASLVCREQQYHEIDHMMTPSDRTEEKSRHFDSTRNKYEQPIITREPIEIKKPEVMVGKLHPETIPQFEQVNRYNSAGGRVRSQDNVSDRVITPAIDKTDTKRKLLSPEIDCIEDKRTSNHSRTLNKWGLIKDENVDNLKLSRKGLPNESHQITAEVQEIVSERHSAHILEDEKSDKEKSEKLEETDVSQSFSDDYRTNEELEIRVKVNNTENNIINSTYDISNRNNMNGVDQNNIHNDPEPALQEQFEDRCFQKENFEDSSKGIYEDNDEIYPESYYEQPTKPHFSTNIAANVILEEDESEANLNDDIEDNVKNTLQNNYGTENIEYRNMQFDEVSSQMPDTNVEGPEYNGNNAQDYKGNESQCQNVEMNEVNHRYRNEEYSAKHNINDQSNEDGITENHEIYGNYDSEDRNQVNPTGESIGAENLYQQEYFDSPYSEPVNNAPDIFEGEKPYQSQNHGDNSTLHDDVNLQYQYHGEENIGERNNVSQGENITTRDTNQVQDDNYVEYPEAQQENVNISETIGYVSRPDENISHGDSLSVRHGNLAHLLESDTESYQMEHGSGIGNEDSDFDFSVSQK